MNEFKAAYGASKKDIRCECGGSVACSGALNPMVNFGFGFKRGEFVIEREYGKTVIGYSGFCMKCKKDGNFILPEFHRLMVEA